MNAGLRLDRLEQAASRLAPQLDEVDRALDQISLQQLVQLRESWHAVRQIEPRPAASGADWPCRPNTGRS